MSASMRFVDSDGFAWQVIELRPADLASSVNDGESRGWLYFFARDVTRSLSTYPENWATLGWAELERLCRRAAAPRARERVRGVPEGAGLDASY